MQPHPPSHHWRWYPLAYAVAFVVAWTLAVGNANGQWPLVGPFLALPIVLIHLGMMRAPWREAGLLALAAVIGFLGDSLLGFSGCLLFNGGIGPRFLAPPWSIAVWVLFAGTLRTSCSWLQGRYLLAAAIGAVGGPLAYAVSIGLGAAQPVGDNWLQAMVGVGLEWLLALPYLAYAARQVELTLAKADAGK